MRKIEQWETEAERRNEDINRLREEAGGAVNVQQLFGGWQAIPEGTRMSHRMRIRDATEDELAMAFFALRQLAREGRIGAHESRGEGYFSARYDLRLAIDGDSFEDVGALRIEDLELHMDSGSAVLAAACERSATILEESAHGSR